MLDTIKKDAQTRMHKSVESLRQELTRLRTGRASTALVEPLKVSYYGTDTPITQVASVAIADARSITITPYEKTMVAAVEKAILPRRNVDQAPAASSDCPGQVVVIDHRKRIHRSPPSKKAHATR